MLFEFPGQSKAAKKKGLQGHKRFHYLFFIGTAADQRGRGLSSALIRRYQDIAEKERLPVWLESTTRHSMRVYENCGFEVVEEMKFGRGTTDEHGEAKKGGDGISIWAMVWWPNGLKPDKTG